MKPRIEVTDESGESVGIICNDDSEIPKALKLLSQFIRDRGVKNTKVLLQFSENNLTPSGDKA